jgi:3-deoxy-manno-octulosonate cytidylyltransferase (CMP-KDO synthetase)
MGKARAGAKKMVKAIGIIPARWGSTRFPGKPLELIAGKPLLQWVIEGSKGSRKLQEICVATDDDRIAQLAKNCGIRALMTDSDLPTGTDRIWQAVQNIDADVVINIQGDEPLIEGSVLDRLVEPFESDAALEMATLGRPLDEDALRSVNTAKIVLNCRGEAIYFSRFPIPYSRVAASGRPDAALKHIGIYGYRRSFLQKFCSQSPTVLEQMEGLEQLRALYLGARIKVIAVDHDSWGVDTPGDVQKIEEIIRAKRA